MNTGLANPYAGGSNTSATVLEYHDTGGQYANVRFDVTENFDLSVGARFSLQIYVPSSGLTGSQPNQVSLKLQDGTLGMPWVTQSEIIKPIVLDAWQTINFDFASDPFINLDPSSLPPTMRNDFNRIVIQVNGEDNFDHVLAYLDDVQFDGTAAGTPVYDYLVWSDEFDVDGAISSANWFHQTQLPLPGSWFNSEIQHYTDRTDNALVDNGMLLLTAKNEVYTDQGYTKNYTSARLNSKFAFTYGRIEVRAKLPTGVGTWPAIWMLGQNINEDGSYWDNEGFGTTGWPDCGEIDIMEHWGSNQNYISSATHTPSSFGGTVNVGGQIIPTASTDFHVYGLTWTPDKLVFDVDGFIHYVYEPEVYDATTWPFNAPQYILLNVAILPDIDPAFTSSAMEIDYVRVYQENPCTVPTGLSTVVTGPNSATLSWDAVPGAIGYELSGGTVGGARRNLQTAATSRDISILSPSTNYEWEIRAYCDPEFSSWSGIENFTTPAFKEAQIEESSLTMSLQPNPASGFVQIRFSEEVSGEIQLLDMSGKMLRSELLLSANSHHFDDLKAGFYLLRFISPETSDQKQIQQELLIVHGND